MLKAIPARHIHKTLSYLSPEKYASLRYPNPFRRLPFIHTGKLGINNYWAVPAKGEYFGGYEVGKAMAQAYLKHLSTSESNDYIPNLLMIIECISTRLNDAIARHQCGDLHSGLWPTEPKSLRGQRAGFVNTIEETLSAGAKLLKFQFNAISEDDITRCANNALKRTDAEVYLAAELADLKAANGGDA